MTFLQRLRNVGLPLLMKELLEQSARPRTYAVRVAYALLLLLTVAFFNAGELQAISRGVASFAGRLGVGREIFSSIIWFHFVGTYVFLPALVSGVLTVEKERNTLGLLLITRLGPWTIIIEKFASRIIPMFTFLLISLPLMSFAYSMGGMETHMLLLGIWFLMLSVLHVGSIAIMASAFFSGSMASFLGTYLLLSLGAIAIPLFDAFFLKSAIAHSLIGKSLGYFSLFPPILFGMIRSDISSWTFGPLTDAFRTFFISVPVLISILMNLTLARYFLVRRADIASTNPVLSLFKWFDSITFWANDRFARGVVLVKESHHLPEFDPVAWRETSKRSLGQFRYLVRVLVTLLFPTLMLMWVACIMPSKTEFFQTAVIYWTFALWIISALLIAVTACNLIASERSRQTLDVLLTTPIGSRDLILQKLGGVRRLMFVCGTPLLCCLAFQTWRRTPFALGPNENFVYNWGQHQPVSTLQCLEYMITGGVTIIVLFHLTMWLAFWIGFRAKSTSKAILSTLGAIVAWCILPMVVMIILLNVVLGSVMSQTEGSGTMCWHLVSPVFLVMVMESWPLTMLHWVPFFPVIVNSSLYGACWYTIRFWVLNDADRGLGRSDQGRGSHWTTPGSPGSDNESYAGH
ncbi:MAG: gliding motility-associated transporter permease protein [Planctomycetaceae bacterium]|nr:gliding motility-associated transporter permease protein [Planctomycetaceae bacterium]